MKYFFVLLAAALVFAGVYASRLGDSQGYAIETQAWTDSQVRLARLEMEKEEHDLDMKEARATFDQRMRAGNSFWYGVEISAPFAVVGVVGVWIYFLFGLARINLQKREIQAGLVSLSDKTGQYPLIIRPDRVIDPNLGETYAITGPERKAIPSRTKQTNAIRAGVVRASWADELAELRHGEPVFILEDKKKGK